MTDTELLQCYVENREAQEAFAELVRRRVDMVYTAALRQVGGDSHRAKDVSQIVFLDLARNASLLRNHPSLGGWLFTATRFAASNIVRSERARQLREQEAVTIPDTLFSPGSTPDWDRLRPIIDEAMHELDDQDRQVIFQRFFERLPFAAIGAELGVTENAARKTVDRALDRLGELLNRRGITSTSAALAVALADQAVMAAPAGLAATVTGATTAGVEIGAAVTTSTISLLSLMTTGKAACIAALVVLPGLGIALIQLRDSNAALLAADSETARLEQAAQLSSGRLPDLESRLAGATAKATAEANDLAAARLRAETPIIAPDALPDAKPALSALELQYPQIYAPLLPRLNLPPEKADYLMRIMADGGWAGNGNSAETANASMLVALQREGIDADSDPGLIALMRDAQWRDRGITDAITALVGEEGYKAIRQYRENDPAGSAGVVVRFVTGQSAREGGPTPQQQEQLRQVLVELAPPNWGMASDAVTYDMTALSQEMLDRAALFLTPAQMRVLQTYKLRQETDLAKRRVQLEKRRADLAQLIGASK